MVDQCGKIVFGLYGPCPDPFPTAFRAELRAVVHVLSTAVDYTVIKTDCKSVADMCNKIIGNGSIRLP